MSRRRTVMIGETVVCAIKGYASKTYGERCQVLGVKRGAECLLIELENELAEDGTTWYKWSNFIHEEEFFPGWQQAQKEARTVAYGKTQYFAVKVNTEAQEEAFLPMAMFSFSNDDVIRTAPIEQTVLRTSKSEAMSDVRSNIKEGEKWIILQTVAIVEPEKPQMRVSITDLR